MKDFGITSVLVTGFVLAILMFLYWGTHDICEKGQTRYEYVVESHENLKDNTHTLCIPAEDAADLIRESK